MFPIDYIAANLRGLDIINLYASTIEEQNPFPDNDI